MVVPEAVLLDDGRLRTARHEQLAILLADDLSPADAWKAVGGETRGNSVKWRAKLVKTPNFIRRLAALRDEKAELEADKLYGEIAWQNKQLYRLALIKGDMRSLQSAVEMSLKIAEKRAALYERANPPPPTEEAEPPGEKRDVGRPAAAQKGSRSPADVRRELLALGAKAPEPVEEDA